MITFKTISWKNFLSTGNQPTKVSLDDASTSLIIGTNGAGKSTILDALTFSLYGKSFRKINKGQLINTTNEKNCFVEIEFVVNNVEWKVERGIKPNIFKIYRDGKELDQNASAIDQQKWLEQNVLKMNYKSFTQIVILGSSSFVPFMQLPTNSRREVVEDLLDIKIFSSMNEIVKGRMRLIKDEVRTLELKKESLKDKVDMQKNFIQQIENQSKEDISSKEHQINTLLNEENTFMHKNENINKDVIVLQEKMTSLEGSASKLREYGNIKGKLSNKISGIVKEHKFFSENRVCPTCEQNIEESFRVNRISDSQSKAEELQKGYQELLNAIKKEEERESQFQQISGDLSKLLNGITQNNSHINGCQKQIKRLEQEIQTITSQVANRNTEHEKLEQFRTGLQDTFENISEKKEKITYLDFTYNLLKDGGVKTQIIKKYLPIINQQANKYLQMMDFYINFKLDEEFTETIESPIHEDFSYASFSEGEKMRIDLALLFTWREIARMKNSVNTNLLIMDEVFDSSLDGFGTEEFLKIIRFVIKDANIFVISHKEGLEDKFDSVIKFEKQGNFSRIEP
jgi:DNA repair exonuclease SbcCD ATPase subunit|tara:strand:- start:898 stop:2610 length:1713 start_codon:yes stop_codon:yes gene_type:complete